MRLTEKLSLIVISILTLIFKLSGADAQRQIPEKEKYGGTLIIAIPEDFKSKELTSDDIAKNFDWRVNAKKYSKEKGWLPCKIGK